MPHTLESENATFRFRPCVETVGRSLAGDDLSQALDRLRAHRALALFDSAGGTPRNFSLLAFDPLPPACPERLADLAAFVHELDVTCSADAPPFFAGGFLGAVSYDQGVTGERLTLPKDPWGWPGIVGGLYTDFLVRDESTGETWLVLGENPGDGRPSVSARRREILSELAQPRSDVPRVAHGRVDRRATASQYRAGVERVRALIAQGEIYQANLSQRMECAVEADPIELYRRLRLRHPAPYLGFLSFDGGAILSASPELLLEFDPTTRVARTRPIKGTAPRGETPSSDRANAEALCRSAKDLAELTMIVDLERNDLGRVAEIGSVEVSGLPTLESYATVHHLAADVSARIPHSADGIDVLAALFPGGSITGAPKLRSMEVIAELEAEGRGFAYGSLLMCDTTGRVSANLLIRTLLWRPKGTGGEVTYRVGAGITWGSDPALEEEETLAKGHALLRALESSE